MARPRRSLDVADLKAMMQMADLEWANAGLIPTTTGATAAGGVNGNYAAMRFLDGYRGAYSASMGGAVESVDEFVGNLLFSIINSLIAQTSSQDPEPVLRPLGGTAAEPDAWRRAWLNQKIVQAQIKEKQYRREVDRAFLSSIILPFGLVRHGYTPDIEEYEDDKTGDIIARFKNQTPDLPWIQFIRPWQVRIDPLVNNFDMDGEVGWIAFQNLYRSRRELDKNPALINTRDWEPTFTYDLRPFHERQRPMTSHPGTIGAKGKKSDSIAMFEEWVIYDASRRTFFGYSPGNEKLVREEKDWPLDWGQLPASILTLNEQLDSPFGIPFPQMVWHEQRLYNKVWTIINTLVNRMRRVVFVNKAAFTSSQAQLENLLDAESFAEFIAADGDVNAIAKEIPLFQIDGQIVGLLYQLKEQIREVLGVSATDRGQRVNVQTAAEANAISSGSAMARSRIQAKFEAFWTDIIRASHRALLNTDDGRDFIIPIIGEQNTLFLSESDLKQGFIRATVRDLHGEFDYGVKLNSTTPIDPGAEFVKVAQLNQALNGMQNPIVNPIHAAERMVTLAGEDSQKWIVSQQQAVQMGQQGMPGEQGQQGQAPTADTVGTQDQSTGAPR